MTQKLVITDYEPPDHPYDPDRAVANQWCEICGRSWVDHDDYLDRIFDLMERWSRR